MSEIIAQIKDSGNEYRADSLKFFIYNTLPGTTSAAGEKAKFLKEIVLGQETVAEISPALKGFYQPHIEASLVEFLQNLKDDVLIDCLDGQIEY